MSDRELIKLIGSRLLANEMIVAELASQMNNLTEQLIPMLSPEVNKTALLASFDQQEALFKKVREEREDLRRFLASE